MGENILIGAGFAFAAVVQPGPLQAFLVSRVLATGWRRTLPAACAPLISDIPIAVLVLLVVGRLDSQVQALLRCAGGLLLLYHAFMVFRDLRGRKAQSAPASAPRTLLDAVVVNLLNPNPYLGWALILGPQAANAWHITPWRAVALVGSFYATMLLGLGLFIASAGTVNLLSPRRQRHLTLASGVVLVGLGGYLLGMGILALVS